VVVWWCGSKCGVSGTGRCPTVQVDPGGGSGRAVRQSVVWQGAGWKVVVMVVTNV